MQGMGSILVFPRLKFQRTITIRNKKLPVYSLDWATFDEIMKKTHGDWSHATGEGGKPFEGTLPEPYHSTVCNLRFCISSSYKDEIQRTTHRALGEWAMPRRFDTMIREMCLKPAKAYIEIAFELLADCILDEKEEYFARGGMQKVVLASAMLYKFWFNQTGSGVAHSNAVNRLNGYIEDEELKKLVSVLKSHQKSLISTCVGEGEELPEGE